MSRVKGNAALAAEALKKCDSFELGVLTREITSLYHDASIREVLTSILNVELEKYPKGSMVPVDEIRKILKNRISLHEAR